VTLCLDVSRNLAGRVDPTLARNVQRALRPRDLDGMAETLACSADCLLAHLSAPFLFVSMS
jgi:hypothetical protein